MNLQPTIVEIDYLKLVGFKCEIRSSKTSPNNLSQVPNLWQQLSQALKSLPNRLGNDRYAIITGDLPEDRQEQAYYFALVAVRDFTDMSAPFVTFEIPKAKLAKFRHCGSPQTVGTTAMNALKTWLPQSNETLAQNCELFIYSADYDRTNPNSEFDYALILKP